MAEKAIGLLNDAITQEEQMEYARSLRMLRNGWTTPCAVNYFEWFLKAANYRGGASFVQFMTRIRADAVATLSEQEKIDLKGILMRKPEAKSPLEAATATLAGRTTYTNWTVMIYPGRGTT